MMSKTKTKKETAKNLDTEYFLEQIMKINEDLASTVKIITELNKDIDRINDNANFACEQLEELRPTIDTIRRRLGLW